MRKALKYSRGNLPPGWVMLITICLMTSASMASVTLPLDGYCRPGRFFPISIDGGDATQVLTFSADGCTSTQTSAGGGRATVPMLATGQPQILEIRGASPAVSLQLRVPRDDERLIASTIGDIATARDLFPGQRLVPIHLDPGDPLPGSPAAWETLDAILLDSTVFVRISDDQRSVLLAGGVNLISIGDSPPDRRWPWQQRGNLWVLSHTSAGPVSDVVNEDVYAPTYAWAPGWSAAVREQVMGAATLLVLITLSLLLRPNRWTLGIAVLLIITTTVGTIAWRRSLGSVARAGGDILIARGGLLQRDAWVYERARESSVQTVTWTGWTHPVFASDAALRQTDVKLIVSPQGDLQFTYDAVAGHTMAFFRREVLPGGLPSASLPVQSPMAEVVKSAYLSNGDEITGEIPGSAGRWDTVVVKSATTQTASVPAR